MMSYEELGEKKECDRCGCVWYQCECSHLDDGEEQCPACDDWFDPDDLTDGICDKCLKDMCTLMIAYQALSELDGWKEYIEWCAKSSIRDPEVTDFLKYVFDERTDTSTYKETLRRICAERI